MFDYDYELKDTGRVTSSGNGTVDGSAKSVNLGAGIVRGNLVIDVFQINIVNDDEIFRIHLMGGSDASFTNEVSLCCLELGAKEVLQGNQDHVVSRYVLPFQNEQAGTVFPYLRVRHQIGGTTPNIDYSARLEKDGVARGTTNVSAVTTTTTSTTTTTTT